MSDGASFTVCSDRSDASGILRRIYVFFTELAGPPTLAFRGLPALEPLAVTLLALVVPSFAVDGGVNAANV